MLNLFYGEPERDRWLPFDRYPRRVIRRIVRGPRQPGGMERYFLNLLDGLRRAGIPYRENPFGYARRHPEEAVGILGKGHLLRERDWHNPIVFGPAVFSHPLSDPEVFKSVPIRKVLVSCEWMKRMYQPAIDVPVEVWPAGVDTERWKPRAKDYETTDHETTAEAGSRKPEGGKAKQKAEMLKTEIKTADFLIYDKVRWEHDRFEVELIQPIRDELKKRGLSFAEIRYGFYEEEEFENQLQRCKAMIFLCEHETQGFAYLQTLACGVPILAWDRGGFWQDPEFYPHRVKFEPVTSVPYWDERCGMKFRDAAEFPEKLGQFWERLDAGGFKPRDYILENLSLEKCARDYVNIVNRLDKLKR
jgi:glycosyltransferase involved in cell wall biosynthesis